MQFHYDLLILDSSCEWGQRSDDEIVYWRSSDKSGSKQGHVICEIPLRCLQLGHVQIPAAVA